MRRRDFLNFCAAAPLAAIGPAAFATSGTGARYLVIVEFNGGNDGLNTVIPYADPHYYDLRPTIAVARDQVLHLDEHVGLHPSLAPMMPLWNQHELAIVQAVGYPQPNRSHFRSIEIWDTGSDADDYLDSGWLARSLPHTAVSAGFTADAVVIGRNPLPVTGGDMRTLVIDGDVESFASKAAKLKTMETAARSPALAHVLEVQDGVNAAARSLLDEAKQAPRPDADFPTTPIGKSLEQTARLILMNHATPVIKVALGSFDTHSRQRGTQDRLLGEFAEALAAFRMAMVHGNCWNRTLLYTYSEFGRRVGENASSGTDHGTAAPVMVAGGAVRGGLYGEAPALTDLDEGDLRFRHDFRSVYNTVLRGWWGMAQTPFDSRRFAPLGFV